MDLLVSFKWIGFRDTISNSNGHLNVLQLFCRTNYFNLESYFSKLYISWLQISWNSPLKCKIIFHWQTIGAAFFLKQWGPYNIAIWVIMPLFIHSIHFQLFFNQLNQTQFHAVLWCLIWFLFRIQLERRGSLVCLHSTVETLGLLSWHLTCPLSALLNLYGILPALLFFIIQTLND